MSLDEMAVLRAILEPDAPSEPTWEAYTAARASYRARLAEMAAEQRAKRLLGSTDDQARGSVGA